MAYLAVNKNGQEVISGNKPDRCTNEGFQARFNNATQWCEFEDYVGSCNLVVFLPKGSIKKLIGCELTWEDEPVELI